MSPTETDTFRFPDLPKSGIKFPNSPVVAAAFAYTKQHTTQATYNHCVRSAYLALLLAKKLPGFSSPAKDLDLGLVVLASVLHDMGWAVPASQGLLSTDKRFEVDGADLALAFLERYTAEGGEGAEQWDETRARTVWAAIALHTTGSIAQHHPAKEVTLTHLGVMADFAGPCFPATGGGEGGIITEEEYREIEAHFPFAGFSTEALKDIMCGICRAKPQTTYDNFVSGFALAFGVDGKGAGVEEFREAMERQNPSAALLRGLEYLEGLLKREA
ncbi:hypothetical protein GGR54DRAFT_310139 [Hypoxylon sp. NC1633]|nr:hypothetical protein GGR54DRAFT_310139 [Hypoxylon sp. NC1633]